MVSVLPLCSPNWREFFFRARHLPIVSRFVWLFCLFFSEIERKDTCPFKCDHIKQKHGQTKALWTGNLLIYSVYEWTANTAHRRQCKLCVSNAPFPPLFKLMQLIRGGKANWQRVNWTSLIHRVATIAKADFCLAFVGRNHNSNEQNNQNESRNLTTNDAKKGFYRSTDKQPHGKWVQREWIRAWIGKSLGMTCCKAIYMPISPIDWIGCKLSKLIHYQVNIKRHLRANCASIARARPITCCFVMLIRLLGGVRSWS